MSKYTVEITQRHPLWSHYFPYEVRIFGGYNDDLIRYDYAMTKWGAKRLAKKLIKKLEGGKFKEKNIASYEVHT